MVKPLVLYHARCPDGMAAAWVLRKAFAAKGVEADFAPADYGSPQPADLAGRPLYLADYCFNKADFERAMTLCPTITAIDHHKTTAPVIEAVGGSRPGLTFVFDQSHSGGYLAWKHCFGDAAVPPLVLYTQDRDLWTWELPFSREVSAYLSALPWGDFDAWGAAADELAAGVKADCRIVQHGTTILAYQERVIEDHIRAAFETEVFGHKVRAVNCTAAAVNSELTGRLAAGRAFAISWFLRQDGLAQFSLRSRGEGSLDVSVLAKSMGGGGHPQAAGFQLPAAAVPTTVPYLSPLTEPVPPLAPAAASVQGGGA